ncbi:leucyl aminopeptidase [Alteriqipengyuania flavescens]|uniref:leucyl aminopeptidase n=1 Tax=Alteriqipengyuania flavescens TaxID=3053610 RepID=UPI0025B368D7|nr:leucyl aminopeptidase [Alteriqipengyuania flavescens]WJY18951.1 leucyl aminopeptidase [Alteriqipengyuania flavescens]WJY24891.1 leucyl aminopeptidase [Alteriqipengyuania flavescens]
MKITFDQSPSGAAMPYARLAKKDHLPADLPNAIAKGAERSRFTGAAGQLFESFADGEDGVHHVVLAGIGDASPTKLEKAGSALAAKFMTSGNEAIAIDFGGSGLDADGAASVLLGAVLRGWRYDAHRTTLKDDQKVSLQTIHVVGAPEGMDAAWDDAAAVAEGIEFARVLVTEPANVIFPVSYVEHCRKAFEGTGAELVVLDVPQMEELGMGSLLGVGQGSEQPSRILAVKWMGGNAHDAPVAFVGKGVTFDTGGISLKPGPGMGDMKFDMGGSAAVVGAMLTLAKRKAKANVVGVVGLVENMPDGKAQRPGDVVKSMSGQTIEVLNTDAEGRLVLADVLTWTQREFKPARIVDLATLTGAMIIALGNEHGGLFSNNDALANDLLAAGTATGDKLWRMPLSVEYDKQINSPIADMQNIGGKGAGSITAAQFLQRFIENDTPWAHLDIAGMVWADKPGHAWGKGATGYGVRLLDRLIRDTVKG